MRDLLAAATFEEFLDSFRVLWCVRVLVYVLLLAAVIRVVKGRSVDRAGVLMTGLGCLVLGGLLGCATRYGMLELGYSPSFASMMVEWEMGPPDWERWEPVFWWARYCLNVFGALAAGAGFLLAGRVMAANALRRDLEGVARKPEEGNEC